MFGRSSLLNAHASLDVSNVRYQLPQIKYLPASRLLHLNSQSELLFEVHCSTPTRDRLIPRRCTAEESPQPLITIIQAIKSHFTKLVQAVLAREKGQKKLSR
jgi:hypothetical protein